MINDPNVVKNRNTYRKQLQLLWDVQSPEELIKKPKPSANDLNTATTANDPSFTQNKKKNKSVSSRSSPSTEIKKALGKPVKNEVSKNLSMVQKLKVTETRKKNNDLLKKQQEIFYEDLIKTKQQAEHEKWKAIVKIQSQFRGYTLRSKNYYIYLNSNFFTKRLQKQSNIENNNKIIIEKDKMVDWLCQYSKKLGLKPIKGLTLESRSYSNSKFKKLAHISALKITGFFRMLLAKKKARITIKALVLEKQNRAAMKIQKFAKFVILKRMNRNMHMHRATESAIVVQKYVRGYLARSL